MKVDLSTGKIVEFVANKVGSLVVVTKGANTGRIGTLVKKDKHPGSFDIATIEDAEKNSFATRMGNVFVVAPTSDFKTALVSLPSSRGVKRTIVSGVWGGGAPLLRGAASAS